MDNLEKVEKLREKTGISYEEAKDALEKNNYDVLDAMVYLEKQGKIKEQKTAYYSTGGGQQSQEFSKAQETYQEDCKGKSVGEMFNSFFSWCGRVLKKSCETSFEVIKQDKVIISIPVLVLVICLIFAFWITIPLLIVGMFCGCRYYFRGFQKTNIDINDVCEKASETCESIKSNFKDQQ